MNPRCEDGSLQRHRVIAGDIFKPPRPRPGAAAAAAAADYSQRLKLLFEMRRGEAECTEAK